MALGEFEIISRIFSPLSKKFPGAHNLKDDCAYLSQNSAAHYVVSMDTIVGGVHFFPDDNASSIGHKALAVNLSDLAAKGAKPIGYLMSISLAKDTSIEWLEGFANGLEKLQNQYDCHLIGGDTVSTSGPLTITITIFGEVPTGKMVLRTTAKQNDLVYVSGTIGDAFLGLQLRRDQNYFNLKEEEKTFLLDRYLHPKPRLELIEMLKEYANSAMDISDGLVADFEKLCSASGVRGELYKEKIPFSEQAYKIDTAKLFNQLITGGDDYEILATVDREKAHLFERAADKINIKVSQVGQIIQPGAGISILSEDGSEFQLSKRGYDHFDNS